MAFNPNDDKYKPSSSQKILPVVLLLDVSGSMRGEKIANLYEATKKMIDAFVNLELKETMIEVAIITFGSRVTVHTEMTAVKNLSNLEPFVAGGQTPLGQAFLMAKDMMDDPKILPKGTIYKPAVIVVSDGRPDTGWQKCLVEFETGDRASKSQRFAIAIGSDRDEDMLTKFTKTKENIFYAEGAGDIADKLEKISTHISMRATSGKPNDIPKASGATFDNNNVSSKDDDDDEYV